jgi:hypothetical protein
MEDVLMIALAGVEGVHLELDIFREVTIKADR